MPAEVTATPSTSGSHAAAADAAELLWRAEATMRPRPLIGNRRIEPTPEPAWDPELLAFVPLVSATAMLDRQVLEGNYGVAWGYEHGQCKLDALERGIQWRDRTATFERVLEDNGA